MCKQNSQNNPRVGSTITQNQLVQQNPVRLTKDDYRDFHNKDSQQQGCIPQAAKQNVRSGG